jgi:uncharacterized Zn-binding protein involved in type VI secretion
MPPAARVTDPCSHPGLVQGPGTPTVMIGGMIAATVGDMHTCMMPPTAGPHPPSPFVKGSATVMIGGKPALRVGDICGCGSNVIMGCMTVMVGG